MGTVTKVTADSITVKTTAKEPVTVSVAPATKFTMGKMAMKIDGLKVRDRVVIHAKEPKEGTLVADTVDFSTPNGPAAAGPATAPKTQQVISTIGFIEANRDLDYHQERTRSQHLELK